MTTTVMLPLAAVNTALSAAAGEPVELVERRRTNGSPAWLVVPRNRGRISATFWLAVQASPGGGIWNSPDRAVTGFCAGAKGWVATAVANACNAAADLLRQRLADGPVLAAELLDAARALGASRDQLDRAARRLGVRRTKVGMRSGWMWSLPEASARTSLQTSDAVTPKSAAELQGEPKA